jgi:drug/metabolite transporter (DMT)-like permease
MVAPIPWLGEICALTSGLAWSLSLILFRRSEGVSAVGLNLFKNVVATTLMGLTLLAIGGGLSETRAPEHWWALILSGLLGITVADYMFFRALRLLGPTRLAVVECTYSPAVIIMAALVLDEPVPPTLALGGLLVMVGMYVVSTGSASPWLGAALGATSLLIMALAIVIARPAFRADPDTLLVEVSFVRLAAGTLGQLAFVLPSARLRPELAILQPGPRWRLLLPAAFLGSWVSALLWLGGFFYAPAGTAAVLNQTTTVFTLILARAFLAEPLTPRRVAGVALGVAGALVVLV